VPQARRRQSTSSTTSNESKRAETDRYRSFIRQELMGRPEEPVPSQQTDQT